MPEVTAVPTEPIARYTENDSKNPPKLTYQPYFCIDQNPYNTVEWRKLDVSITGPDGVAFEQKGVEVPEFWSDKAATIVAQKYFRGAKDSPDREFSVRQIVERVVSRIKEWADSQSYFRSSQAQNSWADDLRWLLIHQHGTFNSPVWFNLGVNETVQQASACFIQRIEDNMESIMDLQTKETQVFRSGSGTGTNFSTLRASCEPVSGGGMASGPISFMKGLDRWAGQVKSGGKTRRAAKICILNVDHPDIVMFIESKVVAEKKAHALIDAGYNVHFDDSNGAYASVDFQNANHSIRVTDEFMEKLTSAQSTGTDQTWFLRGRRTGETLKTIGVLELWKEICDAAHFCGDPGIQFDTTHNKWHTCKASGKLNATNPCSEYSFLDDSACNLASLNVRKFEDSLGKIDIAKLRKAVEVFIIAQEAIVSKSYYPSNEIKHNSHKFRTLGLGFANLGAHLMANAIPYGSEEGRQRAREITSIITAQAYITSSEIAYTKGAFEGYVENRDHMLEVIRMHWKNAKDHHVHPDLWEVVYDMGIDHGYRNAQVTLLAPTGTTAFMMDCDTTGCEPDFMLVKTKNLAGGGTIKIANRSVSDALETLGYSKKEQQHIKTHLAETGNIFGSSVLKKEHYPVFSCAVGDHPLSMRDHINMTAAIQPFISGAISKTMNAPSSITPQEIGDTYIYAWTKGIKSVSVYRDGCKIHQPMETGVSNSSISRKSNSNGKSNGKSNGHAKNITELLFGCRKPLPDPRKSITKKMDIGGVEVYFTVGLYEDGSPGEIFIKANKEGSLIGGLADSFAIVFSLALQHGCPLQVITEKLRDRRFEPSGYCDQGYFAKSVVDYIARWMQDKFLGSGNGASESLYPFKTQRPEPSTEQLVKLLQTSAHATMNIPDVLELCHCGARMIPTGPHCATCPDCGNSTGGCS